MVASPAKLRHLAALVLASALILGLGRAAGPAGLMLAGLTLVGSALTHAILAANRRSGRLARGWIDRGCRRGGPAGLALTTAALAFRGLALVLSVAAVVAVVGSGLLIFRACCVDRYVP